MKRAKGGCGTINERTRYGSVSGTYVDRRQSESCTGIRLLGLQSDVDAWAVPKTDNMRFRGATSGAEVGWEIEPTKSLPGGVRGVPRFPFWEIAKMEDRILAEDGLGYISMHSLDKLGMKEPRSSEFLRVSSVS